ncbi:hypothetical protein [Dyadobacter sediminis]|uniref:Uncharacterized protein n=1 Tax=Dyadobacter sediminis TaxID=1493691 RepID=A0A5R9KEU2_9BACT|nr:hypothetical protein [Dyadobacter sediminis]TLU94680.1 hypothetical protein FEM55_10665 [Dyadobacter sediminis]GGB89082.1 hypothetical protein GCM10011325_15750 [Dyadobacter sediminis]
MSDLDSLTKRFIPDDFYSYIIPLWKVRPDASEKRNHLPDPENGLCLAISYIAPIFFQEKPSKNPIFEHTVTSCLKI